jgi:hypothetical protein
MLVSTSSCLRNAALAMSGMTVACGASPRTSAVPAGTHLGAEMSFLARYASTLSGTCMERNLELQVADRPKGMIATFPGQKEAAWRLRACGHDLPFTLDCAFPHDGPIVCSAHEWPTPIRVENDHFARELEAAASKRPACPLDRSCVSRGTCAEDGFTMRRLRIATPDLAARYEVVRCGITNTVLVRCPWTSPYTCEVQASASPAQAPPAG